MNPLRSEGGYSLDLPKVLRVDCNKTACPQFISCLKCPTQIRYGASQEIDVLFIGEAASYDEYIKGYPFAGRAGKLLRQIIARLNESGDKSYAFSNIVRGWPTKTPIPSNIQEFNLPITRKPSSPEIHNCLSHILKDIALLKPKMICALGVTAHNALLNQNVPLFSVRGRKLELKLEGVDYPLMATYHPAVSLLDMSTFDILEKDIVLAFSRDFKEYDDIKENHEILKTVSEVREFYEELKHIKKVVSFDTETFNLSRFNNKLGTIQFAVSTKSATVIPVYHKDTPFSPEELKEVIDLTRDLFTSKVDHLGWLGHNLKFELHLIQQTCGVWIRNAPLWDTQVMAYLMDENRLRRAHNPLGIYTLKVLAKDLLQFDGYDQSMLQVRAEGNLMETPLDKLAEYGATDVRVTLSLFKHLIKEATIQGYYDKLVNLMTHLYSPVILLATTMERNGFKADLKHLRELNSTRSILLTRMKEIENIFSTNIHVVNANELLVLEKSHARPTFGGIPWVFDLNKKDHLRKVFFDVIGLIPLKHGKSGALSVDSDFQEKYETTCKEVELYSEWVLMDKMFNTFASKLLERVDPEVGHDFDSRHDGRIRSDYLLTNTVTGRFANKNPNLQQCPQASNEPKKAIKNIFICSEGNVLIQLDFKANEIRWAAILAKEDSLAKIFNKAGKVLEEYKKNPTEKLKHEYELYSDIHKANGSLAFQKPISQITKAERQKSKAFVFGLLYGASMQTIATQINASLEDVEDMFKIYFKKIPNIVKWKMSMEFTARQSGYVECLQGRRRRLPIYKMYKSKEQIKNKEDKRVWGESMRQATNAPIQGIASDYAMSAAALFNQYILDNNKKWLIVNAVHDSTVWECPWAEVEESLAKAEQIFTLGAMAYWKQHFKIDFNLPLDVDFAIGKKWGDLKDWDRSPQHLQELLKVLKDGGA